MNNLSNLIRNPLTIALGIILLVTVFSYWPAVTGDFLLWDDDVHVEQNLAIQSLDAEHLQAMFTGKINKLYIPLTSLSFAIEYHFFKLNPFVFHLTNLALHLVNSLFVFFIAGALGLSGVAAFFSCVFFALHPVHVESVAWITERKDVLYAFFYLAAVLNHIRYVKKGSKSTSRLIVTTLLGVVSLLAKPMALSLPLILWLIDWFIGGKIKKQSIIEKIPLCILIALIGWLSYAPHARVPIDSIKEAVLIWSWCFTFYVKQFFFPLFLVPLYRVPEPVTIAHIEYLFSLIAAILIIVSVVVFRKRRWLVFSFLFYFFSIFFLLRLDISDTNMVADRFMYLPGLGFCFALGLLCEQFSNNVLRRRPAQVIFAVLLISILSSRTAGQAWIWNNSIALWEHQLNFYPQEHIALNNLATVLRDKPEYQAAEKEYRKILELRKQGLAIKMTEDVIKNISMVENVKNMYKEAIGVDPRFVDAHYNLGKFYGDMGMIKEAIQYYKEAINIDPTYKDAYFAWGDLFRSLGDVKMAIFAYTENINLHKDNEDMYLNVIDAYNEALMEEPNSALYKMARQETIKRFEELIQKKGNNATSYFNLGLLYFEKGEYDRAISAYKMALDINPRHAKTLNNLGTVYLKMGALEEARKSYEQSIQNDPKNAETYINLGQILMYQQHAGEAGSYFEKAVKVDPGNAEAYFNLGFYYESRQDWNKALNAYQQSIKINPGHPKSYYKMGDIYAQMNENGKAIEAYRKAVEIDPNHTNSWVNLSILSFHEGRYKDAVKYCDEAVLLGYDVPPEYLQTLEKYRHAEAAP